MGIINQCNLLLLDVEPFPRTRTDDGASSVLQILYISSESNQEKPNPR